MKNSLKFFATPTEPRIGKMVKKGNIFGSRRVVRCRFATSLRATTQRGRIGLPFRHEFSAHGWLLQFASSNRPRHRIASWHAIGEGFSGGESAELQRFNQPNRRELFAFPCVLKVERERKEQAATIGWPVRAGRRGKATAGRRIGLSGPTAEDFTSNEVSTLIHLQTKGSLVGEV